jgi:hypothetical protein
MLERYVAPVNAALEGRPPGLTIGVHVRRGKVVEVARRVWG